MCHCLLAEGCMSCNVHSQELGVLISSRCALESRDHSHLLTCTGTSPFPSDTRVLKRVSISLAKADTFGPKGLIFYLPKFLSFKNNKYTVGTDFCQSFQKFYKKWPKIRNSANFRKFSRTNCCILYITKTSHFSKCFYSSSFQYPHTTKV